MRQFKQQISGLLLVLFACLSLFSGCTKKDLVNNSQTGEILTTPKADTLIDGTYTSLSKYYDPRGYGQKLTIVVLQGIITKTTYEELNIQGKNKLLLPSTQTHWRETDFSLGSIYSTLYSNFMEKQTPAINTISGATQTCDNFKVLAESTTNNSRTGQSTQTIVDNFIWTYTSESVLDELAGYKSRLSITFDAGAITQVIYDEYKEDNSKIGNVVARSLYNNLTKETQQKQNLDPVAIDSNYPVESAKYNDLLQKIAAQRIPFGRL